MSKVIAIVDKNSQEVSVSSIKLRKKEVISEERVSSWLEGMASGKYALSTVIPADTPGKYQGPAVYGNTTKISFEDLGQTTMVGSSVGGMLGFFVGMPLLQTLDLSVSATIVSALGMTMAGAGILGFSWHGILPIVQKHYRFLWSQLTAVQSQGVRAWLDTRYGIQVNDDVAKTLAEQVLIGTPMYEFQDINGQLWVLQFDESMRGFLVEPKPVKVKEVEAPAGIRQAPVILSVGAGHLAGEAGKLGKHIDLRLAQLSRFALTVEESHVVARAAEDAREAVTGFERLELLGAGKNGLDRLTGILSLLDGELEAILQAKIAEEDAALISRQRKIEARHSKVEI
jgi:hypothetical protein